MVVAHSFTLQEICYGNVQGRSAVVANDDGVEIEYFETNRVYEVEEISRSITLMLCGSVVAHFDVETKSWVNGYGDAMAEAPREWQESWFQLVDKMVELLDKGPQPL